MHFFFQGWHGADESSSLFVSERIWFDPKRGKGGGGEEAYLMCLKKTSVLAQPVIPLQKMEAGESYVQGHAQPHSEFEASLGYTDLVSINNNNRGVLERK